MPGKSSSSGQLSSSPLMARDCPLHVHAQGRTSLWGGRGDWSFRRREEAKFTGDWGQVESRTGSRSVSLNFFLFMSFGKKEGEAVGQRSEDTGEEACPSQGLPGDCRITVTATTGTGPASYMPSSSS